MDGAPIDDPLELGGLVFRRGLYAGFNAVAKNGRQVVISLQVKLQLTW